MAAAKKKKRKSGAGWSWRLAGIALCAFFALGVITGLSQSGRIFAIRFQTLVNLLPYHRRASLAPASFVADQGTAASLQIHGGDGALVLVERRDGFYTIDAQGELRGPVSPVRQGDLPVLSGSGVRNARATQLLEYAAVLVRAEAGLSEMVSEMHVGGDGAATLYLEHPPVAVALELDDVGNEIVHAARVLSLWRDHRDLIEVIDMTTPGQAVVRLKSSAFANPHSHPGSRKMAAGRNLRMPRITAPEVTASR